MSTEQNGWIRSTDPQTGRTFYANRYTRTTQWDPPPGWVDPVSIAPATSCSNSSRDIPHSHNGSGSGSGEELEQPLPEGWEEMRDPSTGRTFYIDHASKITTWERPTTASNSNRRNSSSVGGGVATGFGYSSAPPVKQRQSTTMSSLQNNNNNSKITGSSSRRSSNNNNNNKQLNQYGNHTQWDQDPRSGSRYQHSHHHDSDRNYALSLLQGHDDSSHPGPPTLDFSAVSVPDVLRPKCPGCWQVFSMTKRRHHCRLCGDVFCDACSSSRTVLPLDGPEFAVPVRVCDCCMKDVKKGNYFSLRRYLTPLQLFDPDAKPTSNDSFKKRLSDEGGGGGGSGEKTKEITIHTVAASLSSLSIDIESMVLDPTSFQEKITIPASVLIPAIGRHLKQRLTAEYAIRVLASLLMLGNVVGEDSFALAIYESGMSGSSGMKHSDSTNSVPSAGGGEGAGANASSSHDNSSLAPGEMVNDILAILEWSGSDSRTLSALEQASKVIFYITEPNFIATAISNLDACRNGGGGEDGQGDRSSGGGSRAVDVDAFINNEMDLLQIDIHRAFRAMLDHATSSASPSLQRWATASLRHLITEDQRRACVFSSGPNRYESFTSQLVSTGGVMILCSLLGSDDADIRTHATSALEAIVIATREIGMALNKSPGKKGFFRAGRGTKGDAAIVDAIVSNGGCGHALAHLLISADESVAMMGCAFALALISPLLTDPRGSSRALQLCSSSAASGMGIDTKDDGLASYRRAALVLVVGDGSDDAAIRSDVSCLPALIQILRSGLGQSWGGQTSRSMKLQVMAGECLAAISLAVGHIVSETADGTFNSMYGSLSRKANRALEVMEQERIFDVAFRLVTSASSRSLDASRNTPQSRLREAAGLILLACSSCSSESASYLISNRAVSELIAIAGETGMLNSSSALRGDWASRGLCFLEASTTLLLQAWKNTRRDDDTSSTSPLNLLLEALDAGAIGIASRVVKWKVELHNHDKAYSNIRVKIAVCFMLSSMFGIARDDDNNVVGTSRLYNAIDADFAAALAHGDSRGGKTDLVASTVALLKATAPYAQRFVNGNLVTGGSEDEPLPMIDLSEACFLAVGSMCGAMTGCFASGAIGSSSTGGDLHMIIKSSDFGLLEPDKFSHLRRRASAMSADILTMRTDQGPFLPSVLIGILGESCIVPALRLTLAVAQNGEEESLADIVRSGMLIPLGDILQNALTSGDRYTFSAAIAIIRFCGPYANPGTADAGSIASLKNAIRTLSTVLAIAENSHDRKRRETLNSLKVESLTTLEALSSNESLQSSISNDALPALAELLNSDREDVICSALKTIQRLIALPSSKDAIASTGIMSSLVQLLREGSTENIQEVALELLQTVASARPGDLNGIFRLLSCGALETIVTLIGDSNPRLTEIGLEIVELIISIGDASVSSTLSVAAKEGVLEQLRNALAGQDQFIRALTASMLSTEKVRIIDDALVWGPNTEDRLPFPPLYGPPLLPNKNVQSIANCAVNLLFKVASLMCCDDRGGRREDFLNALLLREVRDAAQTVAIACCVFLDKLGDETNGICVPTNSMDRDMFLQVNLPLVRGCLMGGLSSSLEECLSSSATKPIAEYIIETFKVPQTCLSFCKCQTLAPEAIDLFENVVMPLPIETMGGMLLADKSTLMALFDLVTGKASHAAEHTKHTFALVLGNLAKAGLLPGAINRLDLRRHAIAALSAAVLIHGNEDSNIDEDEESLPRICIESLAAILSNDQDEMEMSELESRTMATAIGKTLSTTVLNRFFVQANLETTMDSIDHSFDRAAISKSAEARLLCSLAASPESLAVLANVGGLEAISLIAHEGIMTAITAIQKACEINPKSIVEVDAHLSIMDALISIERKLSDSPCKTAELREVALHCIQIITKLIENDDTMSAVAETEQSMECLDVAAYIISASSSMRGSETPSPGSSNVSTEAAASTEDHSADSVRSKQAIAPSPKNHNCAVESEMKMEERTSADEVETDTETEIETENDSVEKEGETDPGHSEPSNTANARKQKWEKMLLREDLALDHAVFLFLKAISRINTHREAILKNNYLIQAMMRLGQIEEISLIGLQMDALDMLESFTPRLSKSEHEIFSQASMIDIFSSVVESRTRTLQATRDRHEQIALKKLLQPAVLGLQSLFCVMDADRKRSLEVTSNLFIFMTDSLFKGSKSRRSVAQKNDGVLFCNTTSFFMLSLGDNFARSKFISRRFISSLIRFVMMTSGLSSLECHIPVSDSEGSEYWAASLTHCLFCLSCVMNETSQEDLGISFTSLIEGVQFSVTPNSFMLCLQHLSRNYQFGASSVSARQIMAAIDRLSC